MYLTLAIRRAYQQAVDDRHGDIELLEDFRLLLHFARLDELVETLFGEYQSHQILLNRVLVGDIMHILHLLGVKAYEAEVELLHLGDVPLQRLQYHIVAGRYVYRTAQTLLCAYQYAVDGGVELRHYALTLLERHISLHDIYRSVGEAFTDIALIEVKGGKCGTADGYLARYLPYQ